MSYVAIPAVTEVLAASMQASIASVMFEHGWSLWALLLLCAAGGQVAEQRSKIGRLLSAPLISMLLSAGLAASGVIPFDCPSYGVVWDYLMPMAAACFLLETDLAQLFTTGGSTLTAFVIGSFGMVAGSLLGWHLLSEQLGPSGWKVVACLCASYVGGSVNFAAVAKVIGLSPSAVPSAMAADNLAMAAYLAVLMSVPVSNIIQHATASIKSRQANQNTPAPQTSIRNMNSKTSASAQVEPHMYLHAAQSPSSQGQISLVSSTCVLIKAEFPTQRSSSSSHHHHPPHNDSSSSSSSSSESGGSPGSALPHLSLSSNHSASRFDRSISSGNVIQSVPVSGSGGSSGNGSTSSDKPSSSSSVSSHIHTSNHIINDPRFRNTQVEGQSIHTRSVPDLQHSNIEDHLHKETVTQFSLDDAQGVPMSAHHLSVTFAAAAFCCASAQHIAAALSIPSMSMLVMAGVATCVACLAQQHRQRSSQGEPLQQSVFAGSSEVGSALMSLFFTIIGASAGDLRSLGACGWLVAQLTVMVSVHWVVLAIVGAAMFKLPRQALLIGSNACIGGPATAAAMAMSKGWSQLVQPALMTGSLGYAVGTGAGLLVAKLASGA